MQRLFGIKVGPVWAIYPEDLEELQRAADALAAAPARVRRARVQRPRREIASRSQWGTSAGTDDALLKPHGAH